MGMQTDFYQRIWSKYNEAKLRGCNMQLSLKKKENMKLNYVSLKNRSAIDTTNSIGKKGWVNI